MPPPDDKPLSPRKLRRAARLRMLIEQQGGNQGAIGAVVGVNKSHMSHLASGKKGIGDDIADRLEREYGYPNGWLDWPEATAEVAAMPRRPVSISEAVDSIVTAGVRLSARDRETAAILLGALLEDPENSAKRGDVLGFFARRVAEETASKAASGGA